MVLLAVVILTRRLLNVAALFPESSSVPAPVLFRKPPFKLLIEAERSSSVGTWTESATLSVVGPLPRFKFPAIRAGGVASDGLPVVVTATLFINSVLTPELI